MTHVNLETYQDSIYMRIREYGKNRLHMEGYNVAFHVDWDFLVLVCSRMDQEELIRLYRAASYVREARINKAYATWNMAEECVI